MRGSGEYCVVVNEQFRDGEAMTARDAELIELAGVAYVITDARGVITEANRPATELLGVSSTEVHGKPLGSFVADTDRAEFSRRLHELKPTRAPRKWRMWLVPRSRHPLMAELRVVRNRKGGDEAALEWTLADITEQTSAEAQLRILASELEDRVDERTEALREESARLAAVVENMPAALIIVGADGNAQLVNDRAIEILADRVEGDIREWEWEAYRPDGARYRADEYPLRRALDTGEVVGNERMEVVTADGLTKFIDVSAAPVRDANGLTIGALVLFRDVTAQEGQERAEREFVTNAAHQLQSPLSAIVSAIDVLQAGAKDKPERDVFLGHIERETNRLARLAQALLVLARVQTGVEAPRDEVVALAPLLTEVGASLRPAAGVDIEISCPDNLAVVTNRQLVEQALINVADNAAKYTRQGRISLSADTVEGAIEIVVADTGAGIPAEEQSQVFDRFYRGSSNGASGFGLGFAIVRSAVEAIEGDLELSSEEGSGTTVRIRLPHAASMISA